MDRYTTLGAKSLMAHTSRIEAILRALLFPVKFIHFYALQLNFMNGWQGLWWSGLSTYAYILKFLKTAGLR
jgi:hypothetical protein